MPATGHWKQDNSIKNLRIDELAYPGMAIIPEGGRILKFVEITQQGISIVLVEQNARMADLYICLSQIEFPKKYVREVALPD